MPSYLITGSSRGIGLGFVQELLKNPENQVLATARSPDTSDGLQKLRLQYPDSKRLILLDLDISKPESITKAAQAAAEFLPSGLDVLISNAGISRNTYATFDEIDTDEFLDELRLNTVSILQILRAFRPLVSKSTLKKVIVITSSQASIGLVNQMPDFAFTYGVGKAALNMLVRRWGKVYREEGVTTLLIHPGWVASDMGMTDKEKIQKLFPIATQISIEECAMSVMKLIDEARLADCVQYLRYDGATMPW